MTVIDTDDGRKAEIVAESSEPQRVARLKHHRASRWMHWINFPLLTIMIWSGMRIYWADVRDPFAIGVGDFDFEFWPTYINETFGLERRLARGMAFHFNFGWLFAINGFLYVLYTAFSGEWRQLLPERKSMSDAVKVFLHDIGLGRGKPLPPQARYNGAQRLTYTLVIFMGFIAVYSGLAIYKPTQLSFMTRSLGGYEWAKGIHFGVTIAFMVFFVVHILQVARAGFANFWSMVTGYIWEDKDPDHTAPYLDTGSGNTSSMTTSSMTTSSMTTSSMTTEEASHVS